MAGARLSDDQNGTRRRRQTVALALGMVLAVAATVVLLLDLVDRLR